MRILVTGGAGFIGSNLCDRLLEEGNHITVVDNLCTGTKENLFRFIKHSHFRFIPLDITSPDFFEELRYQNGHHFDEIYHLACPTGVPNIEFLGEEMIDTCSTGTKNVLRLARDHGAKLLFTSSSEIYGDPKVEPQSEEYSGNVDPQGFRANYEEGKRFSETLIALYVKKYKLHAVTVRLFNVYGPYMSMADHRVIPRFILQASQNKPLTVHGNGSQTRTLCYVSDVTAALVTVLRKGNPGEIFNIGSNKKITMLDLAKKIIEHTNSKSEIIFVPRASHDHDSRLPDLTKIHALGWKQKVPFARGIELMINNFQERLFRRSKTLSLHHSPRKVSV